MNMAEYYSGGYRNDRTANFHDLIRTHKNNIAINAAALYGGKDAHMMEAILKDIDFANEKTRQYYKMDKQDGTTVSSKSGNRGDIQYIH